MDEAKIGDDRGRDRPDWIWRRLVDAEADEWAPLAWSFAWFFCLLGSYYLIRPVRETLGTVVGAQYLDRAYLAVFLVMLGAAPVFSWLVARLTRRQLVPLVYRFSAACLIAFSWLVYQLGEPTFWLGIVFYAWVSVFNLFAVSLFWSVLADLFSEAQGRRLFGPIAAGGSLGGLAASLVVGSWAERFGIALLLLLSVLMLEMALFCFRRLDRRAKSMGNVRSSKGDRSGPTGGSVWQGFVSVGQSPYLLWICVFLVLGKFCATVVYFQQIGIVEAEVANVARRAELFAWENGAVQMLALLLQLFLASRIIRWLGLPASLALLPVGLVLGLVTLSVWPSLQAAFAVQIFQRSASYGLLNPAREVLFTVVSREDKYKAKSFIDTAIFRGGDVVASRTYAALLPALERTGLAMLAAPVAAVWTLVGWWLGRLQQRAA